MIRDLGAHFRWDMQDTFVDAVAAARVSKMRVVISDPSSDLSTGCTRVRTDHLGDLLLVQH